MSAYGQKTPGHQKRLGEPWRSFSRRDKIFSLLAIVVLFVIINLAFSDVTNNWVQDNEQAPTTEN